MQILLTSILKFQVTLLNTSRHLFQRVASACTLINHSRLNHHKHSFSIVGTKIWNSIPESYRRLPKHIFKKKIQALLFVTLETLDSYADTSNIISEIKK